jgi:hypothetical protein
MIILKMVNQKTVAICGSMSAAKEMVKAKKDLEKRGLKVHIQEDIQDFVEGKRTDEDKWRKIEIDPFKNYFKVIKKCEGILVVNTEKRGIKGYIGGNTLIEMAFAYVLDKKIFLLNEIPQLSYTDEIAAFKPVILKGNLRKIRSTL